MFELPGDHLDNGDVTAEAVPTDLIEVQAVLKLGLNDAHDQGGGFRCGQGGDALCSAVEQAPFSGGVAYVDAFR